MGRVEVMEAMSVSTATVIYHHEPDGQWWAESPDVDGFTAVGATLSEVRELARSGIPFYLDVEDVELVERNADGSAVAEVKVITQSWTSSGSTWFDSTWGKVGISGTIGSAADGSRISATPTPLQLPLPTR